MDDGAVGKSVVEATVTVAELAVIDELKTAEA
jgi:hypothetical protein